MTKNLEQEARTALDMVTRHGVAGAVVDKEALEFGLSSRLYSQSDVDSAQRAYEARKK